MKKSICGTKDMVSSHTIVVDVGINFNEMTAHTRDFSHELAVPILLCRNNK